MLKFRIKRHFVTTKDYYLHPQMWIGDLIRFLILVRKLKENFLLNMKNKSIWQKNSLKSWNFGKRIYLIIMFS